MLWTVWVTLSLWAVHCGKQLFPLQMGMFMSFIFTFNHTVMFEHISTPPTKRGKKACFAVFASSGSADFSNRLLVSRGLTVLQQMMADLAAGTTTDQGKCR